MQVAFRATVRAAWYNFLYCAFETMNSIKRKLRALQHEQHTLKIEVKSFPLYSLISEHTNTIVWFIIYLYYER